MIAILGSIPISRGLITRTTQRFTKMFWPWSCLVLSSVPKRRVNFVRLREKAKKFVTGADQESGQKDCSNGTRLGDLPECIITAILCLTEPADVARLACVNRSFRASAYSDNVWLKMLPHSYTEILAQASHPPARTCSKKEVYDFLTEGVFLQNGTREIWLDRATGAVCQSIGARELTIRCYNQSIPACQKQFRRLEGSRFPEVECISGASPHLFSPERDEALRMGSPHCSLIPGSYVLSWRVCLRDESKGSLGPSRVRARINRDRTGGPTVGPITFSFKATGNAEVNATCYLAPGLVSIRPNREVYKIQQERLLANREVFAALEPSWNLEAPGEPPLGYRVDPDGWIELDVGKFNVESEDSTVELGNYIDFGIIIRSIGRATSALYLDCVMIRPSFAIPPYKSVLPFHPRIVYVQQCVRG